MFGAGGGGEGVVEGSGNIDTETRENRGQKPVKIEVSRRERKERNHLLNLKILSNTRT